MNPLQFGPARGLPRATRGPRAARSRACSQRAGVDLLWEPRVARPLSRPATARACASTGSTEVLEGASRPGHFEGVATVVLKLLERGGARRAVARAEGRAAGAGDRADGGATSTCRCAVRRGADGARAGRARAARRATPTSTPSERAQAVALSRGLARRACARCATASARRRGSKAAVRRRVARATRTVREDYVAVVDAASARAGAPRRAAGCWWRWRRASGGRG